MDHEADVRSVDAHPERHRRDDDVHPFVEEVLLVRGADPVRQSSVIRHRGVPLAPQPLGERFDLTARQAIDDAGFAVVARENGLQLLVQAAAPQHPVGEIRPIE